ncbi:MAG: N-acetylmuramoyl-L-alanine amidase, partial [Ignavibacteria bacterium]|nr:N-acetylmuramoyl-L-alanine amidase [Ignavibacteria bacterium]
PRNTKEKDVNLSISLKLKQKLEEKGAYVSLTHTDDPLPLRSRKQRVLISEPDVSISIHNNAVPDGVYPIVHNGTSVYFYNPNAQLLATKLHKHLLKDLNLPNFGLYWDNLYMCRIPETIAVLVEPAFMSLPEQEKMLLDSIFQEKIAKSLCTALEEFFDEVRE